MADRYGPTLDELSSAECYALLNSRTVGRLGVVDDNGYPLIVPVNYAMDESNVVIRSKSGTKLAAADDSLVTFQIDDFNPVEETGWSVLLRGKAEILSASDSAAVKMSTVRAGVRPWVPGDDFRWLRIVPAGISGRRITPGSVYEWWWGTAAYM